MTKYCRLVAKHDAKDFTRHCRSYFMEVVSTLCFGGQSAPEPDVIKMLMNMMFAERQSMISTSAEKKTDVVPVITSSLLQLLLEHKYSIVEHNVWFSVFEMLYLALRL